MKRFGHVRLGNSTAAAQLYALHSTVLALACCGAARASSSELSSNGSQRHREQRQRGHQLPATPRTYGIKCSRRARPLRPSARPHPCPCNDPPRLLAQQVGAARSRREKRESQPAKQRGSSATFSPPGPARVDGGWIDRSSANVAASSCPDRRRGADRRTDSRHGGCLTECLAGKWGERGCRLV